MGISSNIDLAGIGIGSLLGAGLASSLAYALSPEKVKLRNALLAATLGGVSGAFAGKYGIADPVRDYAVNSFLQKIIPIIEKPSLDTAGAIVGSAIGAGTGGSLAYLLTPKMKRNILLGAALGGISGGIGGYTGIAPYAEKYIDKKISNLVG